MKGNLSYYLGQIAFFLCYFLSQMRKFICMPIFLNTRLTTFFYISEAFGGEIRKETPQDTTKNSSFVPNFALNYQFALYCDVFNLSFLPILFNMRLAKKTFCRDVSS